MRVDDTESAPALPSNTQRPSGKIASAPPYAASTCSQTPCSRQTAPISGNGSTLVVEVVPAVVTTASGRMPTARSSVIAARNAATSRRKSRSVATRRTFASPRPRVIAHLSMCEWPWSEVLPPARAARSRALCQKQTCAPPSCREKRRLHAPPEIFIRDFADTPEIPRVPPARFSPDESASDKCSAPCSRRRAWTSPSPRASLRCERPARLC